MSRYPVSDRMMFENAADTGFLAVDARRREIRFEGDKERYRIPAAALLSCEVEKSLFVSTAHPDAPGFWLAVMRAFGPSGVWEAPVVPRLMNKPIQCTRFRRKAAEELQARIKTLLSTRSKKLASSNRRGEFAARHVKVE